MKKELSPRETEVLRLIARGAMPRDVAKRLDLSPNTVATHLTRIKVKLGAKSTIHAAVLWAVKTSYGDAEYLSWGGRQI